MVSLIKNVVTPVSFSPLIMAQFMGAAPRYLGNKEPCKLIVPKFEIVASKGHQRGGRGAG